MAALVAGCGSIPRDTTIAHRLRHGDTFRYVYEEYGTAVDLAQGTASPRMSAKMEISLRVRDIAPGKFIAIEMVIERTTLTIEGGRPLSFDSKEPRTFDAARRHPDGILAALVVGKPIRIHVMPEGGILKVESAEMMRAAAAPGGTSEAAARSAIESAARSVVQPHTFMGPLRAGDRWSDLAPRAGTRVIPGEGVTRFVGFEGARGRRCARFETAVPKAPVIPRLLLAGWEAISTTWVDLETGMIVEGSFRWRVEAGYGPDRMRSGDWRGGVRLLH
jgi:hypothetical protein